MFCETSCACVTAAWRMRVGAQVLALVGRQARCLGRSAQRAAVVVPSEQKPLVGARRKEAKLVAAVVRNSGARSIPALASTEKSTYASRPGVDGRDMCRSRAKSVDIVRGCK